MHIVLCEYESMKENYFIIILYYAIVSMSAFLYLSVAPPPAVAVPNRRGSLTHTQEYVHTFTYTVYTVYRFKSLAARFPSCYFIGLY